MQGIPDPGHERRGGGREAGGVCCLGEGAGDHLVGLRDGGVVVAEQPHFLKGEAPDTVRGG